MVTTLTAERDPYTPPLLISECSAVIASNKITPRIECGVDLGVL
jgi:hypothetical protein